MKKLESTRKIISGSVIRIYKKGFGYSKITVIDNTDYYLAAMADDDLFNAFHEGDLAEAYIWVEDVASYEFRLQLIGRIVSGPRVLFFSHTDEIARSTERKCLTATVRMPIKFFMFDPGDTEKGITSEEIVYHEGAVILLSDREATIQTKDDIRKARFLKGHIVINGQIIELVGMVDSLNEPKGIYNVLFASMHEKDRKLLLDFIFSTYRE
ncbi:MAG TPA: hypothetical protein PLM53_00045 [Spirochaetota bacterium]|nr:hypothetical protein [Spirochaetota bacterium]HPC43057.1 hypothetical protein [Spirochaetota bacterium]HPL17282.1 hypothetical protein [Spirochaetota bacterium]HQF06925.1 hypothetical protein [Spirochaetota bacterium]HQH95456.1 hypothetical protein [Spirochaetota bacterium]